MVWYARSPFCLPVSSLDFKRFNTPRGLRGRTPRGEDRIWQANHSVPRLEVSSYLRRVTCYQNKDEASNYLHETLVLMILQ